MRTRTHRITTLAAAVALAGAVAVPVAGADAVTSERASDVAPQSECDAWAARMTRELAFYGITGRQAASYIAQRADNPCHSRITVRSLFHAGDPG
jgi:hypothetical protein